MPRKARLDIPGLLQHVIVRGIERKKIFFNDDDRSMFIKRFSSLLEETGTDCYAWALIPNHFHLLLCPHYISLSNFMRRLLTGYAINFNHSHSRSGHLFQNRYKSIVCEEETYLLELVRYIHLNPLRARLVSGIEELDVYPWSGHAVLMGNRKLPGQNVDKVLVRFGKRVSLACREYRQFIEDGIAMGKRPELVGGGLRRSKKSVGEPLTGESHDDRILGSGAFVDDLRQEKALQARMDTRITLPALLKRIAEMYGVDEGELRWRSKKTKQSEARAVFCYSAVRMLRTSGKDVGEMLNMGQSAVSQAVKRGDLFMKKQPAILSTLESFFMDN